MTDLLDALLEVREELRAEGKTIEEEDDPPTCARCGEEYSLHEPDMEPTRYCDACAHALVEAWEPIIRLGLNADTTAKMRAMWGLLAELTRENRP